MIRDDDESSEVDPELFEHLVAADAELDAGSADAPDRDDWEIGCLELLDRAWSRAANDPAGPPPGSVGRYQVRRELGRGGFGVVYLAHDPKLGRDVALKVPLPGMAASPEVRRRFTREALAVSGLDHPNIVPVHDARTVGPVAYIISTYCPGPSLAAWLQGRSDPVPPRAAARLAEALARGVEHAHERGILHRDLKPANVMLGPGGDAESAGMVPRVTDFGLAKLADDSAVDETRTGLVIGSAPYMAPEQAAAARGEIGPATDVHALGATLYEILVGRPPFGGRSQAETLHQVLTLDPVPPQLLRRDVPRDLQTICLHALRKNPAHRYPSAAAFAADLARFLDGEAIVARPASVAERGWRWARRHPVAATAVVAAALLVGLINLGMGWSNARLRSLNDQLRREVGRADSHAREVDRQRKLVADREAITDRHLHAARLNLARQAIEVGQVERAQAILTDASAAAGSHRRGFVWRYLWDLSRRELALWGRHDGLIHALALAPDGATLASSDQAGRIVLWDVAAGRPRATFGVGGGTAERLAFAPDGATLAVAGLAAAAADPAPRVALLDVPSGRPRGEVTLAGMDRVDRACFAADSRALGVVAVDRAGLRSVRAWTLPLPAGPAPPRYAVEGCFAAHPTPDGRSVWTNDGDGRIRRRDLRTGRADRTLGPDPVRAGALACSPDGRLVAAAVPPARVLLWDLDQGGPPRVVADEAFPPDELLFTGDGGSLLVVAGGYQSRLIRLADGAAREILPLDPERRGRLRYQASPDGRWVASWGGYHPGGTQPVTLWDVATGRPAKTFRGRLKYDQIVFHPRSGALLLSNDYDVASWHPSPPPAHPFERFDDHRDEVWAVAFAPDGRTVASGGDDDRIRFWDPATGARGAVLAGHGTTVSTLAWHPDGGTIAAGSLGKEGNLKLWDVRSNRVVADLPGHTDKVRAVAFSPDGKVLASAGTDRTVRVWDGATGRPLAELVGHDNLIRGLAFARDGRNLASVGDDGVVRVWDWARRRPAAVFAQRYMLSAVAYSPDGAMLASGDQGGFIHLRDTRTWETLRVVRADDKEIRALVFSPDGETLVSAGMSPTIRFWDPATGQPLIELIQDASDQINALAFSPDGSVLTVADHAGRVTIYHAPSP